MLTGRFSGLSTATLIVVVKTGFKQTLIRKLLNFNNLLTRINILDQ